MWCRIPVKTISPVDGNNSHFKALVYSRSQQKGTIHCRDWRQLAWHGRHSVANRRLVYLSDELPDASVSELEKKKQRKAAASISYTKCNWIDCTDQYLVE